MARQLEIIKIADEEWFVDERLNEVRQVKNPNEKLTIDEAIMLMHLENSLG